MKKMIIGLVAIMSALSMSAQGIYGISVKDDLGNDVSLADYKGKVLLIVNTATRCGFTPQYDELEALYEKYHAQGFEILDFPCNQFGEQAPGTIEEIHQFCTMNFNIKFPQFDKIDVNGANESPLFTYLKAQKGFGGFDLNDHEPTDKMTDVDADILMEMNPVLSNIMARRSVRKYLDKPVEHEKLEVIVRAGINAPSGMNRQPWIVRVVEDQQLIADVNEVFKRNNPEQVARDPSFKNMFRNAPNLICVCTPAEGGGELDAGLLGENMMLAAQAMGLGTCCLGGPVRFLNTNADARFFLDRLDIPEGYKLNYILAIGYPDEQPEAKPRDASKVKYIQ